MRGNQQEEIVRLSEEDESLYMENYGYPQVTLTENEVRITLGWFMPHDPANEEAWYFDVYIHTKDYKKYHKEYLKRQAKVEALLKKEATKLHINLNELSVKEHRLFQRIIERKVKQVKYQKLGISTILDYVGFHFDFWTRLREYGHWSHQPWESERKGCKPYWLYADGHVNFSFKHWRFRQKKRLIHWCRWHLPLFRRIQDWRYRRKVEKQFKAAGLL